jgi:carbonic anhydrase/acetyltransferase-like protein (isoleucine patch superfamily)
MIKAHRGKYPQIGKNVYIAETATVIGDVILGDDCSVWPSAVIRGDYTHIEIGSGTNVQDGAVIHGEPTIPVHIGSRVTIGHLAHVHGARIDDDVMIGSASIVLDNVVIESHVQVAAGALVSPGKHLSSGGLYAGLPAKHMRDLSPDDIERIAHNAAHYIDEKNLFLQEELKHNQ